MDAMNRSLLAAAAAIALGLSAAAPAAAANCPAPASPYSASVSASATDYWRLGDTAGRVACDSVGANAGAYTGGYSAAPDVVPNGADGATRFDGATGYVQIPDSLTLRFSSAMSAEAWIRLAALPASGDNTRVLDKKGSWFLRVTSTGAVEYGTFSGAAGRTLATAAGAVSVGSVYHLIGTYDGTSMRIYVNGSLAATKTAGGALDNFNTPLDLAAYLGSSRFFSGVLDDVAVYGRALSATDVADHYALGTAASSNAPPSAPPTLTASPGDGQVTLSWSAATDSDLVGYQIFRRNPDGSWPGTPLATTSASSLSYRDAGLADGTPYTYRVVAIDGAGQTSGPSPEATATPAAAADPVIAAAGDVACAATDQYYNGGAGITNNCRQRATSDLLVGAGLAGVLPLGDEQYQNGELANFQQVYGSTWGRVNSVVHPAVGNHEYQTAGAQGYFDYFDGVGQQTGPAGDRDKGYYSYDIGSWHVIALNSDCSFVACAAGSAQEQWLKGDLAAHTNRCVLAYWHHPLFNSGTAGQTTSTRPFWTDLYNGGADVVLNGHQHSYERFSPQTATGAADSAKGIREFIVGTGGMSHGTLSTTQPNSQVRDIQSFGVLRLTLHAASYDWQFVHAAGSGTLADSGSQTCH